jgi:hypothetical protein
MPYYTVSAQEIDLMVMRRLVVMSEEGGKGRRGKVYQAAVVGHKGGR